MYADIIFIFLSVFVSYDILNRYQKGSSYRQLKKQPSKTAMEQKCLDELGHFFRPNKWHMSYFILCLIYMAWVLSR